MRDLFVARLVRLAVAAAVISLTGVLIVAQSSDSTKGAAKSTWKPAKTVWGDPDLQGVWSYATLTPLERPAAMAGREFMTAEEASARNAQATEDRPPAPGDTGTYNAHWFDRGKVLGDLRTSLIVDPPDGRLPLTPAARKQLAERAEYHREHPADSWLDRTPWDRCIMYHGVPPISTGYNNTYQIFQTRGQVVILDENIHDVRVIPVDGRPRLGNDIRQWNGSSRGRWEGETLVVETTNFNDKMEHRFPSSSNTRAVERFKRVGEDMIDYRFTIEDPTIYTRPWTAVRPMPRLADYKIYEYACHEGNYAMTNILTGERTLEKEAVATASTDSKRK